MIHPLADKTQPFVKIAFTRKNGSSHVFYSCVNEMSGDRLSYFDNNPPRIGEEVSWVKGVILNIKKSETVTSFEASKHFK